MLTGKFTIGHKLGNSHTFEPEVVYSQEQKCFFIDVAGFMDAHGQFIDLINSFIIKYLFVNAKSVKFLCPITFNELRN